MFLQHSWARLLCLVFLAEIGISAQTAWQSIGKSKSDFGNVPLYFEENRGQMDQNARYLGHSGRINALITNDGTRLSLNGRVVSMHIVGANPKPRLVAENPVDGVSNYYFGSKAITGVPHYSRVRASDILPGIDVVYYGNGGEFEYDLVLSPAADPARLRFRFAGPNQLEIAPNGDLLLKTGEWEVRQRKPKAWQREGSQQRSVECGYEITASGEVALALGRYDRSSELTIDPILSFSTYLGGSGVDDLIAGMAVDSSGLYVTGWTTSTNFPFTSGARHDGNGLFVTKFNLSGTALIYSTVIGGGMAAGIAIDSGGNAYITGTSGTNFPNDGIQPATGEHTFAMKLDSTGGIVYSTVVAGNYGEDGYAIAVDASGAAYIAGTTYSSGFPATPGAFRTALSGTTDGFVVKFTPLGKVAYATYLGGNDYDRAYAIAVDSFGNAYVVGTTTSTDFPTTPGAYARTVKGGSDAFISVLNPTGTALVNSTLLGGFAQDEATGIARDAAGNLYVAGNTYSNSGFPTTPGSYVFSGGGPATFVVKFDPSLSLLLYSVRVGGFGSNPASAIAVDPFGAAYVAGSSSSPNFPTTPGALETPDALSAGEMFVLQVSPSGDSLTYATLLGAGGDRATSLAIDGTGSVYVGGSTVSSYYPTTVGAFQRTPPKIPTGGQGLGVISKIDFSSPTTCFTSLSTSGAAISGIGGTFGFTLTRPAGCPWLVTADTQGVIFTNPPAGVSTGSAVPISGSVPPNPSVNQRIIKIHAAEVTFTINQAGASCRQPAVSPLPLTLDAAGSLRNVNVVLPDTCGWDAISGASWLTIGNLDLLYGYQIGSRTLTISAPAFSFSQRTTTLTIAKNPFTVTQTGSGACTATAQATLPNATGSGGTGEIRVTTSPSSCTWAAESLAPWIQLASGALAGQGNGPIPYIVAANPGSLARSGQVLVADQLITITQAPGPSGVITSYSPSRFAGGADHNSDGELATDAYIGTPLSPFFDPLTGNFYFVDAELGRVRVVTPDGKIDTIAGAGAQTGENIPAKSAQLNSPAAVTVDSSGSIYIGDSGRVSRVSQGLMATFAGTGVYGFSGDNGPATGAQIKYPWGLVSDASNQLYISDQYNNRVRRVTGGIITTFAGGGSDQISDGELATMAALSGPTGITLDSAGGVLFADGNSVRKVSQGVIGTLAIQGGGLSLPQSLAFDPAGNLFIVELTRGFRKVAPGGGISSPVIPPTWSPDNVAADSSGNVYLGDGSTHGFWKLTPVSFCSYSVSQPLMQTAGGGAAALTVSTAGGCNWTAVSDLSWVTVTSGASGTGGGTVNFTVASNPGLVSRTGTIAIAGQLIQVTQAGAPVLSILKSHAGNFTQGQQNASYTVTVANTAGAPSTSGTVTVTETVPSGLTLVSMSGAGWTCGSNTCTRSDALAGGNSYPPMTVTVSVALNATSPQLNQASVSGSGSAVANVGDSTNILSAPVLGISKTHTGSFSQGQQKIPYMVTVSNASGVGPTSGIVTVTETAPSGLTLLSMSGAGWTCGSTTCTRSDALAGGSSYPPITVTVNVAGNATSPQVNQVSVSGGGSAGAGASDSTIILNASTLSNQRWVASTGNDGNTCDRSSPCRTFQGAHDKTSPGGSIKVVDAADYSPVTINKAITIEGAGVATIGAPSGTGITVNAGSSDEVVLRSLSINGLGGGGTGIQFNSGPSLRVENVAISDFSGGGGKGMLVSTSAFAVLTVENATVTDCNTAGITISSSVIVATELDHVRIWSCGTGLAASNGARITLRNSEVSLNSASAVALTQSGQGSEVDLVSTTLNYNNKGVQASGANTVARITRNMIMNNGTGLSPESGGQIISAGDNTVVGNVTNGAPTSTLSKK